MLLSVVVCVRGVGCAVRPFFCAPTPPVPAFSRRVSCRIVHSRLVSSHRLLESSSSGTSSHIMLPPADTWQVPKFFAGDMLQRLAGQGLPYTDRWVRAVELKQALCCTGRSSSGVRWEAALLCLAALGGCVGVAAAWRHGLRGAWSNNIWLGVDARTVLSSVDVPRSATTSCFRASSPAFSFCGLFSKCSMTSAVYLRWRTVSSPGTAVPCRIEESGFESRLFSIF